MTFRRVTTKIHARFGTFLFKKSSHLLDRKSLCISVHHSKNGIDFNDIGNIIFSCKQLITFSQATFIPDICQNRRSSLKKASPLISSISFFLRLFPRHFYTCAFIITACVLEKKKIFLFQGKRTASHHSNLFVIISVKKKRCFLGDLNWRKECEKRKIFLKHFLWLI